MEVDFVFSHTVPLKGKELMGNRSRRNLKYLFTGILMVSTGVVCVLVISLIDRTASFSSIIGIFPAL